MIRSKSFLLELAEQTVQESASLENKTFIFPNRRAVIFFKNELKSLISNPTFAPHVVTIEEFIASFSDHVLADRLELVAKLHAVYNQLTSSSEPFESFYFWGEMMLRDFEEVDKHLVNAQLLYRQIRSVKEIDATFDYLTEHQKNFLESFWGHVEESSRRNTDAFMRLWRNLCPVYEAFKESLRAENLAYEGMLYRYVVEDVLPTTKRTFKQRELQFVGLNVLTPAEEKIISFCLDKGWAEIHWDADQYYVENGLHEAGNFFRKYQEHEPLKHTFPQVFPSFIKQLEHIQVYGVGEATGQARCVGQLLRQQLAQGAREEDTLIVLPDEKLLIPILNAVSGAVSKVNVTMGYPLNLSPAYNLIELLFELQMKAHNRSFFVEQVRAVLNHPYIQNVIKEEFENYNDQLSKNKSPWIQSSFFQSHEFLKNIFGIWSNDGILWLQNLRSVMVEIGKHLDDTDQAFMYQFHLLFNRMEKLFHDHNEILADEQRDKLASMLKLVRSLVRTMKIPFSGEPLEGLQIMGLLETRCLDFKNVFILSMNEGIFPGVGGAGSFVPHSLRKAFNMPVSDHHDATSAYLFYRMLQRAEQVTLLYVTQSDGLGQGEKSRFLHQLHYESSLPIQSHIWQYPNHLATTQTITINKTAEVMKLLFRRFERNGLSPSAINTYLDCKLRFYFRYVAGIKEPDKPEAEVSPANLGNFLHTVMELFYQPFLHREIKPEDLIKPNQTIQKLMSIVLEEMFDLKVEQLQGEQLIVWEVVKKFVSKIVEADRLYAPFNIKSLEQSFTDNPYEVDIISQSKKIMIDGLVDRIDQKENVFRIVDYKTGKDINKFNDIPSLFDPLTANRNKAAFQLLLYSLLYQHANPVNQLKVQPALMSRGQLFGHSDAHSFKIRMRDSEIDDVTNLLPEFETNLIKLVNDMWDAEQVFDQTSDFSRCQYCPYVSLCNR